MRMRAFVRKLPELTPEQYETMVKNAPRHEELMQELEAGNATNPMGSTSTSNIKTQPSKLTRVWWPLTNERE